jgi:hypothetical protein
MVGSMRGAQAFVRSHCALCGEYEAISLSRLHSDRGFTHTLVGRADPCSALECSGQVSYEAALSLTGPWIALMTPFELAALKRRSLMTPLTLRKLYPLMKLVEDSRPATSRIFQ